MCIRDSLGIDPGDVPADGTQPTVIVALAGGRLEAQVEQLFLGLAQFLFETQVVHSPQLVGGEFLGTEGHQMSPPSRLMKRHFMGSLCIARRRASRATGSVTPESSKSTRPGLMLATHHSGEPLPEPMRVSAGFLAVSYTHLTLPTKRIV